MEPVKETVKSFKILGFSVRTNNRQERNPSNALIPELWEKFYAQEVHKKTTLQVPGSKIYGVYSDYDSNSEGDYTVTAGVQVIENAKAPEGFSIVDIDPGEYMVFECKGDTPEILIEIWNEIWDYFTRNDKTKRKYRTDFEVYLDESKIHVFVGIL